MLLGFQASVVGKKLGLDLCKLLNITSNLFFTGLLHLNHIFIDVHQLLPQPDNLATDLTSNLLLHFPVNGSTEPILP